MTEKNLLPQLKLLDDWYNLGLQLDVPKDKLREIEDAYPDKPSRCKEEIIYYWLKTGENPSWKSLAAAITNMDLVDIAIQIHEKYLEVSIHCFIIFVGCNAYKCHFIILLEASC